MKKLDRNTIIIIGGMLLFLAGLLFTSMGGKVASAISRCCF